MKQSITVTVLFIVFFIQAGIGAPIQQTQPAKTVIVLKDRYVAPSNSSQPIPLGDLCVRIQSTDSQLEELFTNLPILTSPQPGEEELISRPIIYRAFRAAGIPYYNINIEGALQTLVLGPGHPYTVQEMISDIQKNVLMETGWSEDELVLRVLTPPTEEIWLPNDGVEKEISRVNPYILGNTRYEISFFRNQVLIKKVPLILSILHRRTVYVTADSLNRGDEIHKEDIREIVQLINNTMYDNQLVDNKEELIGRQCRIPLRKGSLLKWNNLDTNYLAKWGETVQMIIRTNGMLIQTIAVAQKKGAKGDIIPVKTKGTGKIVKARILSKGLVELIAS